MYKQKNYRLGSRSLSDSSVDIASKAVIMLYMCQFRDYIKESLPTLGYRIRPEGLIISRITNSKQIEYLQGYTLPAVFELQTGSDHRNRTVLFAYVGDPGQEIMAWKSLGAALNIFKEYVNADWKPSNEDQTVGECMLRCLEEARYILQR